MGLDYSVIPLSKANVCVCQCQGCSFVWETSDGSAAQEVTALSYRDVQGEKVTADHEC